MAGYVRLTNENNSGDAIHAVFMGFCGDWTDGSVLEQYDWRDYCHNEITCENTALNWAYLEDTGGGAGYTDAGENYFLNRHYDEYDYTGWDYSEDRIAVNPDGEYCGALYILPMNIRNARRMVMTVSDAETGQGYYADSRAYVPKAYYYGGYGWRTGAYFTYDGTDFHGDPLPNDTRVNVSIYAVIDYGEDVLENADWANADLDDYAGCLEWSFPCRSDSGLPELEHAVYDPGAETLTVTLTDNQHLAAVEVYGCDAGGIGAGFDYRPFYGGDAERETTVTFDVSGCGSVFLAVGDYAANENWYYLDLSGCHEHTADTLTFVAAKAPTCTEDGSIEYYVCSCGRYFSDAEATVEIDPSDTVVPALGHDWGEWEIVRKATEDEEGRRVLTCSVCGEKEEYVIPVLPHTHELVYVPAKDNSCEEDGNIAHWCCEKYGKYFADMDAVEELREDEVIIQAHGHDTELVGYKAPTSSRPGYSGDEVCKICGKVIKTGHVIEPTEELFPYVPTRPTKPTAPDKPEEPTVPDEPVKPEEPVYSVDFEDVGTGSWYYGDVAYVAAKDLMNGVDDAHFAPSTNLTRAMLVTILYRMVTIDDLVPQDHFFRKLEAVLDLSLVYEETARLYSRTSTRWC